MRPFPDVPGVEVEHRFVQARGLAFHVACAGAPDAPPLVLLHGWPQHWFEWRKVLPALAERRRVLCPDLRGLGWSAAPDHGYAKENLADDVLAVLDELGVRDPVDLIGHDWGGWIGWLLAIRRPSRLRRFLALNIPPPWGGDPRDVRGALELWRFWYQGVLASPGIGARAAANERLMAWGMRADNVHPDTFSDADLHEFTAALAEPERARASSLIYRTFLLRELGPLLRGRYRDARVELPVLTLFGVHDGAISPRAVQRSLRPGDPVELELVGDSGHFIAEERPDLVIDRAGSFLQA